MLYNIKRGAGGTYAGHWASHMQNLTEPGFRSLRHAPCHYRTPGRTGNLARGHTLGCTWRTGGAAPLAQRRPGDTVSNFWDRLLRFQMGAVTLVGGLGGVPKLLDRPVDFQMVARPLVCVPIPTLGAGHSVFKWAL